MSRLKSPSLHVPSRLARLLAFTLLLIRPSLTQATTEPKEPKVEDEATRFANYEIRVIRPRFFAKRHRLELGAETSVIMNQTFIYTYLATGILTYHFNEELGLEFSGSYGLSLDKSDKQILHDTFKINTTILRTEYLAGGALLWTPVYGKYQLSSGRLIYFDTFASLGGGMTGVLYTRDNCVNPARPPDPAATVPYPTGSVGLGQRFFLNKEVSLKWDLRDYIFMYNTADGECNKVVNGVPVSGLSKLQQNVMFQIGASRFF